jgi:hypothetical protein
MLGLIQAIWRRLARYTFEIVKFGFLNVVSADFDAPRCAQTRFPVESMRTYRPIRIVRPASPSWWLHQYPGDILELRFRQRLISGQIDDS